MVRLRSLLALMTALFLTACATGPLYRAADANLSSSVGYRDQELSTGAYEVSFTAPESAGMSKTQDLALLRAAELTLAKGHVWFELITTNTKQVQVQRPHPSFQQSASNMTCNTGNGAAGMGCSYSNTEGNSIGGMQMSGTGGYEARLITTLVFIMGDGQKPSSDHVYEAKATADHLRASVTQ